MSTALRILQGSFGRVALLDMDKPLVTHAHPHCHVLLKSSGADTYFSVRGRLYPLADDTAVLVNAWEPHAYSHEPDAPDTTILALYIEPPWLADTNRDLSSSAHPRFFSQSCVTITPEIRAHIDWLTDAMVYEIALNQDEIEERVFALMIAVVHPFSEWRSLRHPRTAVGGVSDFRIRKVIARLTANSGAPMEVGDLLKVAGLSRPHFFHMFKEMTGLTPGLFNNVLRMERAVSELSTSPTTITDIAVDLGFDEQGNFTRFFRHHLGISPRDYRRIVDVFRT